MSIELNPKKQFSKEEIDALTEQFTKKDVMGILQHEYDVTVPDWEHLSVQEIIEIGLGMLHDRFVGFKKFKRKK